MLLSMSTARPAAIVTGAPPASDVALTEKPPGLGAVTFTLYDAVLGLSDTAMMCDTVVHMAESSGASASSNALPLKNYTIFPRHRLPTATYVAIEPAH